MQTSFHDRLSRIGALDASEQEGQRPASSDRMPSVQTAVDKQRMAIINACLLGIIWMLPTGWVLGEPAILERWAAYWAEDQGAVRETMTIAWYMALASFMLFNYYNHVVLSFWNPNRPTTANWAFYISGISAGIIAYGPLKFAARFAQSAAEKYG